VDANCKGPWFYLQTLSAEEKNSALDLFPEQSLNSAFKINYGQCHLLQLLLHANNSSFEMSWRQGIICWNLDRNLFWQEIWQGFKRGDRNFSVFSQLLDPVAQLISWSTLLELFHHLLGQANIRPGLRLECWIISSLDYQHHLLEVSWALRRSLTWRCRGQERPESARVLATPHSTALGSKG